MKYGLMAAWPDPIDIPVLASWLLETVEEQAATPLARFRAEAVERCHEWRRAAFADGWDIRQTYAHEPLRQAWTGERDGFKVLGVARPIGAFGARLPVAALSIWAPDGMAVPPPAVYNMEAIRRYSMTCMRCEASPVETVRVAFVGRYCVPCAEIERPLQERPGWCD